MVVACGVGAAAQISERKTFEVAFAHGEASFRIGAAGALQFVAILVRYLTGYASLIAKVQ